ncbi:MULTISPECIES: hypothetical protein [Rhodococcus]|jgi:hypothetical protein|nr:MULTISPECIES: hypothetical protein [Rhodococcus]EID79237.1 hypothetical protein W59_14556 [Rhodococcus opacus RKJ300 = JCM 13270]QQZ19002.1 hypothetical protein GO592_36580 [Rhodococcus sp. 21391]
MFPEFVKSAARVAADTPAPPVTGSIMKHTGLRAAVCVGATVPLVLFGDGIASAAGTVEMYGNAGEVEVYVTDGTPGENCLVDDNGYTFGGVVDDAGFLAILIPAEPGDHQVTLACDSSGGYGQWVTVTPTGPGPGPAPAPAPGPAQGYFVNIYGGPGGADIFIAGAAPGETCVATTDANEALFLDGVVDDTGSLTLYFGTPPGEQTVTVVCDSSGAVAATVTVT